MAAIALILAALLAGATTGIGNVAAEAIKDSYDELRRVLRRKLAGEPEAEAVINGYIADQERYEDLLRTALWKAGADRDEDILSAAKEIVEKAGPEAASKYSVILNDSTNVQVGDRNEQHNIVYRGAM